MTINLKNIEKKSSTIGKKPEGLFSFLSKELIWSKKELLDKEKEDFYTQLGILLDSGLDIKTAFQVLQSEKRKKKYTRFISLLYDKLILGVSLSNAAQQTNCISLYEFYTIKIGEETGKLSIVLRQLSLYYRNRIQQRRNVINMLSYPIILMITVIAVVVFMLNMIVPMFEDLFSRFNSELPALTLFILNLSSIVKSNSLLIILVFFVIGISFLGLRKSKIMIRNLSEFVLKVPIVNQLVLKIYLSKFCQLMSLLSASSIPLVTSLQLVKKIIGFYPFEQAIDEVERNIMDGSLLWEAMAKFKIFDSKLISLTKVGEEVNQLHKIYSNLSSQYLSEVEFQMKKLNTIVEPLIIVIVGGFVAVILVSMYLPMFKMSSTMF